MSDFDWVASHTISTVWMLLKFLAMRLLLANLLFFIRLFKFKVGCVSLAKLVENIEKS
jgi:hypothetical protein